MVKSNFYRIKKRCEEKTIDRWNKGAMRMWVVFFYSGLFLTPVLSIVFCVNLVEILKKIKTGETTRANTFWLTVSFTMIMWSIAAMASFGMS